MHRGDAVQTLWSFTLNVSTDMWVNPRTTRCSLVLRSNYSFMPVRLHAIFRHQLHIISLPQTHHPLRSYWWQHYYTGCLLCSRGSSGNKCTNTLNTCALRIYWLQEWKKKALKKPILLHIIYLTICTGFWSLWGEIQMQLENILHIGGAFMGRAGRYIHKQLHLIVESRSLKRLEQAMEVYSLVTICVTRRDCWSLHAGDQC